MSSGWLTTKKVGRDDRKIAAASKKAVANQRVKRGLSPTKAKAKANKRAQPPRRRKQSRVESSDDESEEPWEEEDEISEDEEEDVELPYEESSDEDSGTFLQKSTRRNLTMKEPMLKAVAKAKAKAKKTPIVSKSSRKNPSSSESESFHESDLSSGNFSDGGGMFVGRGRDILSLTDSDRFSDMEFTSSGDELRPKASARKKKAPQKVTAAGREKKAPQKAISLPFSSSSSDEEPPKKKKKNNRETTTTSRYFGSKNKAEKPVASDFEDDTPVKPHSKRDNTKKRSIAVDDEEDDITPRKSLGDSSYHPDDDDGVGGDTDEDEFAFLRRNEAKKKKSKKDKKRKLKLLGQKKMSNAKKGSVNPSKDDPDDSEVDEDVAFLAAIKASRKSYKKEQKKSEKTIDQYLEDSEVEDHDNKRDQEDDDYFVDMAESDEDDDEDDGPDDEDDNDAYMDDDEREASQVLAAANELSASVMKIMTSWASDMHGDGDESQSNKDKMVQGIIVDGAIAMTSMRRNPSRNNNSQQAWISNDVMREVLPTVTLAEYQLLGVNWLAMLHSMTCKGLRDKATNVNGILADEMGLGKTCQTIAFLAYLKYSRSKGKGAIKEVGEVARKGDDHSDDDASDAEGDDDEAIEVDTPKKDSDEVIVVDTPIKETKYGEVTMRTGQETSGDSLPHLIIVPASVVSNWEREFSNFAPHMSVIKYHGTQDERADLKKHLRAFLPKNRKKGAPMVDVILAPITYFQKETSDDRDFLRKFAFDYLICDEGHLLKNAKGLRYKNIDRFKSRHRLLLTGTPIQNSPQELMALLCFLMPLFKKRTSGFDDDNDDGGESMLQHFVNLEGAQSNQETSHEVAYRKLKQLFAPFVLRRKKKDVLSQIIPPKSYEVEFVDLEHGAREQYNKIISEHLKAKKSKTKRATDHLFTSLRKAAHHPHLLRTRHTAPSEKSHLVTYFIQYGAFKCSDAGARKKAGEELEGYSDFDLHLMSHELIEESRLREKELERYLLTEVDLFASAKLARLKEILPTLIDQGHRILMFSVWTSCLDLLGCLLESMHLKFMRMDGSTAVADRQERIDKFNADNSIPIFLLSTNACGMGINLTSADTCIMHDISLNPFVDLQAEDRCHRIGQKKPVKIIKLVARDTVDHDIYNMQEKKKKMNAAIMESSSEWSKEEKKEKSLILKNIVERHGSEAGGKGDRAADMEKENGVNNVPAPSAEAKI